MSGNINFTAAYRSRLTQSYLCEFYVAGVRQQAEEYQDWKADVQLAPGLFDVTTWTTAPHWAGAHKP